MKIKHSFAYFIQFFSFYYCISLLLTSCHDIVDVDLEEAPPRLVVDAWLNNLPEKQIVKLTYTQAYFDSSLAIGIEEATVIVENKGLNKMNFRHQGQGNYTWTPKNGDAIAKEGDELTLSIRWNDELYIASTTVRPVPKVDSISIRIRKNQLNRGDGHYAQLHARDIPGEGHTYWIKTFKNNIFLNKPAELNIAYDAGIDFGANLDGVPFISVIQELVNGVPDNTNPLQVVADPPYQRGDSIRVEIHSISREAFLFLKVVRNQTTKGENAVFSLPFSNPRGNIFNPVTGEFAIGVFCVSSVESLERPVR